tara:strand:+ start:184 stop:651 length:468 start_codon:yes stop_codon:yes gene_type:complete
MTTEQIAQNIEHPLTAKLRHIGELRKAAALIKSGLNAALALFEESHKGTREAYNAAVAALTEAEEALRTDAVIHFRETGDKHPVPGVGVNDVTTVEYEPLLALEWAIDKKMALSLNRPEFEKLAKASTTPPDFVVIRKEPRGQLAQDIGKVLGEE